MDHLPRPSSPRSRGHRQQVMLFYEPLFLFVFLPVVFSIYLMLRRWTALPVGWVALASCCFYGWSEPIFFWLVALSSALDFALGNRIAAGKSAPWLSLGVLANLALLGVPKYSAFVTGEIANPVLTLSNTWCCPVHRLVRIVQRGPRLGVLSPTVGCICMANRPASWPSSRQRPKGIANEGDSRRRTSPSTDVLRPGPTRWWPTAGSTSAT